MQPNKTIADSFDSIPKHEISVLWAICGFLLILLFVYTLVLLRRTHLRRQNAKRRVPLISINRKFKKSPVESVTMSTLA